MAIDHSVKYPAQVDVSDLVGYPYGAAKNATTYSDGTGYPLEKTWVNDLFGFFQSLLNLASLVPSGVPDKVGASQYITALYAVIAQRLAGNTVIGTTGANTCTVNAATTFQNGFTSGDDISVFGAITCTGDLSTTGSCTIGNNGTDTLTVNATPTFVNGLTSGSDVQVFGAVTCTGDLTTSGSTVLGNNNVDTLTVNATSTFAAQVTCSALLVCSSGISVTAGNIIVNAGNLTLTAGAFTGQKIDRMVIATDGDAAVTVATCDHYYVPSGTFTGNHAVDLSVVGASIGKKIKVSTDHAGHTLAVNNGIGGSVINTLQAASGQIQWAEFTWLGSSWIRTSYGKIP